MGINISNRSFACGISWVVGSIAMVSTGIQSLIGGELHRGLIAVIGGLVAAALGGGQIREVVLVARLDDGQIVAQQVELDGVSSPLTTRDPAGQLTCPKASSGTSVK